MLILTSTLFAQVKPADVTSQMIRKKIETLIEEEIDGRTLYDRPKVWRLEPPLPPGTTDVELVVENLEFTFYLFEELALSEGPLPVRDGRWIAR